jgi:hypothetical protein
MFKKPKIRCPMTKEECWGAECHWHVTIMGKHPQTGQDINMPDCAIRWLPTLLIENSKVGRETGAAVEDFRNQMVRDNAEVAGALNAAAQLRLRQI